MCMTWTLYIKFFLLCFLQALLIYIKKDEVDVTNIFVSYFNFWVETTITSIPFKTNDIFWLLLCYMRI